MPSYVHPMPRPLQPYVQSCVGYDYFLAPDATHHGLPSTALTVIIAFDEPIDCGWLDGGPTHDLQVGLDGLFRSRTRREEEHRRRRRPQSSPHIETVCGAAAVPCTGTAGF